MLLEERSYKLSNSSHILEYIPVIYTAQKKMLMADVQGRDVSVILRGFIQFGEA